MAKRRSRKKVSIGKIISILVGVLVVVSSFYFVVTALIQPLYSANQETDPAETFIQKIAPHAQKIQRKEGLMASISIGQAILESDFGTSDLSQAHNNLFGIKAYGNEPQIEMTTKEFVDDQWIEITAAFRTYPSWNASLDDHFNLLKKGVDWNPNLYSQVIGASNYKEAAYALQEAGYATDPNYDQKIISVIESYQLQRFDNQ